MKNWFVFGLLAVVVLCNMGVGEDYVTSMLNICNRNGGHEEAAKAWAVKGSELFGANPLLALDCYNKSILLNPEDGEVWSEAGFCLFVTMHHTDALEAYDIALRINPLDGETWSRKGHVLKILGNDDASKEAFSKAKALGCNECA